MSEHFQSVKGATTIALYDMQVSAVSGKSLSDTNLFSLLLLSHDLKLFLLFFSLKINMKQIFYRGPRPVVNVVSL